MSQQRIVIADLPPHQTTHIVLNVELHPYFQRLFGVSTGRFAIYTEGNSGVAECVFPSYYHERFQIPSVISPGVDVLGYKVLSIISVRPWSMEAFAASVHAQIHQLYYA